jgi:hypothetical protein
VVIGAVLFFRKKGTTATMSAGRSPSPIRTTAAPTMQNVPPPLAVPPVLPPAPRPSLVQTGLNVYSAGCNSVLSTKGVTPAISQLACDPRFNPVTLSVKAGGAVVDFTKSLFRL